MAAADILADRFPQALGAVLAGSAARGEETATSDLDLLVLLSGPPAPLRVTERHHGRLVEFFVHTDDSLTTFLDLERQRRRSPLLHMLAFGVVVRDSHNHVERWQERARLLWDTGPNALEPTELEDRRYRLTALLDDLADTDDPGERIAVATVVFADLADLALVSRGHWTGTGRWLVRHLRQVDPDLGRRLLSGLQHAVDGDPGHLLATGRAELDHLGGPLDAGYERRG